MKVLYIPCHSNADPLPTLQQNLQMLAPYGSIGIVGTAQHMHRLDDVARLLKSTGKKVHVGGQILGCRQQAALKLDVDCILYVGSGRFHPLGVALKTDKPLFMLNPLSQVMDRITDDEKRRWLGKRKGAMARALESQVFGIMVSTKDGQMNLKAALKLKKQLEKKGKQAYIVAAQELSPNNLLPFKVDCWINTACPRIAGDEYNRPVVNRDEIEELIGYF
jgi:2-(3-amino-3-carboxypropyl)histidine synthase